MAWLNRGEVKINYEWIESDNPYADETLILLHGVGLDYYSWDFIVPYFRKNYHVMRYDLRGHGESDTGKEELTIELLSRDLDYLVSELSIKSFHIVAQGFGGLIAVQFAAQKRSDLKTLELIAPPIQYPMKIAKKIVNYRKEKVQGQQSVLLLGKEIVKKICYLPAEDKETLLLNAYQKVSPETYFALFHTNELESALVNFQQIDKPILILSGSEDSLYPPELNSANLNFNFNARYLTVPYASFMIQMDQPEITADWITYFIEKSNKARNMSAYECQKVFTTELYTQIMDRMIEKRGQVRTENRLQVNIMNGFGVYINGKRIAEGWGKRKAKQILTYLVLRESALRDDLCDLLWPDTDLTNARNRLRVSLHYLKQLLDGEIEEKGLPILITEREHVFLKGIIQSDLRDHIKAIRDAHMTEALHEKAGKYKQILNEKTDNPLPGLYEDWFLNQRTWIENEWEEMERYLDEG